MTSNVGARELVQNRVGFGDRGRVGEDDRAYKELFSPEFRNRLDARVQFSALDPKTMRSIVGKFIKELEGQLAEREVTIDFTEAAVQWLAEKGYDPDFGARPLERVVQTEVKKRLGDEVLFGKLEHGGHVEIGVADGKLTFGMEAASGENGGEPTAGG